jgi:hypothetical protein
MACVLAVLVGRGETQDVYASFDPESPVQLSTRSTDAAANTTYTTEIEAPDTNLSLLAYGAPGDSFVAYGPGRSEFSAGTHPALGDVVGTFTTSLASFGFSDTPCAANVTLSFTLLNATVDIDDTIDPVPLASTNPGDGGTLANMWTDNGASPLADSPWNAAWSGLTTAEGANGLPAQVDDYPSYLNTIFLDSSEPLARYAAAAQVAGVVLTLNIVVFEENYIVNAEPSPFRDFVQTGHALVAVFNDPTHLGPQVPVTDFCTPFSSTTTLFGTAKANGCNGTTNPPCNTPEGINSPAQGASTEVRYTNPATGGTYLWVTFHQSLRDSDGDGKENQLDPCPNDPDNLDPRLIGGDITDDADLDAIPDDCDPSSNVGDHDEDNDGWSNALDNCPTAANSTQAESELTAPYTTAAPRGGPKTDGMGDACDTAETQCTGGVDDDGDTLINDGCAQYGTSPEVGCVNNADDDGDTRVNDGCPSSSMVATGQFETTLTVTAQCIDSGPEVDADSDGFCASSGAPAIDPDDPYDNNAGRTPEDYDLVFPMPVAHSGSGEDPPIRQPIQVCNDGIDNDGDTLIDDLDSGSGNSTCQPKGISTTDSDGDGFGNETERHVGTDALGRCGVGAESGPSKDWPLDFVSGGIFGSTDKILIDDFNTFLAPRRLDASPGDALYDVRWDLDPGAGLFGPKWINVADFNKMLGGVTAFPPMFGGERALDGPACTAHPTYGD